MKRHARRQRVVEDHAAHGGGDVLLIEVHRLGMGQILVVVGRRHVQHLAGVAQANGRESLDFLGFEGHQDFFSVGEDTTFALPPFLALVR